MDDHIINILKSFKSIEPPTSFTERSRRLITALPQTRPSFLFVARRELMENLKFTLALALGSALIFAIFSGVSRWGGLFPGGGLARENAELLKEAEGVNVAIELGDAKYYSDSAIEVASLLREIKSSDSESVNALIDQAEF